MTTTTFTQINPNAFNTKAKYLAWRANWRQEYKALSQEIRAQKAYIKKTQQEHGSGAAAGAQSTLVSLRREATNMLIARAESKILAQQKYLDQKALQATKAA